MVRFDEHAGAAVFFLLYLVSILPFSELFSKRDAPLGHETLVHGLGRIPLGATALGEAGDSGHEAHPRPGRRMRPRHVVSLGIEASPTIEHIVVYHHRSALASPTTQPDESVELVGYLILTQLAGTPRHRSPNRCLARIKFVGVNSELSTPPGRAGLAARPVWLHTTVPRVAQPPENSGSKL